MVLPVGRRFADCASCVFAKVVLFVHVKPLVGRDLVSLHALLGSASAVRVKFEPPTCVSIDGRAGCREVEKGRASERASERGRESERGRGRWGGGG